MTAEELRCTLERVPGWAHVNVYVDKPIRVVCDCGEKMKAEMCDWFEAAAAVAETEVDAHFGRLPCVSIVVGDRIV